jgi:hypothetical protein
MLERCDASDSNLSIGISFGLNTEGCMSVQNNRSSGFANVLLRHDPRTHPSIGFSPDSTLKNGTSPYKTTDLVVLRMFFASRFTDAASLTTLTRLSTLVSWELQFSTFALAFLGSG